MDHPQSRGLLLAAFASVYLIWGSTYLAVRIGVASFPPFLMLGSRFLVAGLLMYLVLRARGQQAPRGTEWRSALIIGVLLLLMGNGAVGWAVQTIPSGIAALTVAVMPFWMVLFDWRAGGVRPGLAIIAGLVLGFAGVGVLIGPEALLGERTMSPAAALVLNLGTIAWSLGSIYSRSAPMPRSALMGTAAQMICGGGALIAAGVFTGEISALDPARVTAEAVIAWFYLVTFGSIVAFTSYVYMLRSTTPAKASTYAYVNPVIAVFLGWAIGGEALSARVGLAVALIILAVALIINRRNRPISGSNAPGGPVDSSVAATEP